MFLIQNTNMMQIQYYTKGREKMSRIENPNLEKFIKSFVVYTLEKCDIFRKVYKKGFAQKKLEDNVKHVFSNKYSATLLG